MRTNIFLKTLFALTIALTFSLGAVAQTDPDRSLSPYFFVKGDPSVDRLPLKDTSVELTVAGVIADVRVVQMYANEGKNPINATYVFPASTRAAVYGMRMRIGDEVIVARIKEREAAKQEFETAKKEGKSASLLEESRPNVFTMNLANLMPNEMVEIELRYTELIVPTDGLYEVVYPTVVGPRYSSGDGKDNEFVETPYLRQGEKPTSSFHLTARVAAGLPIYDLGSPSHIIAPEWFGRTDAILTLTEDDHFQGNRDFVLHYRLAGDQITSGLLLYQGIDENFFLYMAQPPKRVAVDDIPPREFVFVVDVSGSMEGFPLETSKRLLEDLIGNLRPNDYFNVVLFAGDSTALSEYPLAATKDNISRAIQLIEQQRGAGGTELQGAMEQAMALKTQPGVSRSLVLITDGYISAEEGVFNYIRKNLGDANVFAFGIGQGVNRYLIEGVAQAGLGEPFIAEDQSKAAEVAARFREYIASPVLTDISFRTAGFEIFDVHPGGFPDLLAQRPIVVFGKWRGSPTGSIELLGKTGRGNFSSVINVADYQPNEANAALRYLWARTKIAELSDHRFGEVTDESIRQVTDLGLKYNLLTRYTSFIAVRERVVNPNAPANDVNQPLPLPVGVDEMAIGSEPELVWMLAFLGLITSVVLLLRRNLTNLHTDDVPTT